MGRIVFLLEEASMVETLRSLFPKLYPEWRENEHWVPVPHRGKSDLEKSIPVKLRGWREPGVRFVILRDNDGGDCMARKAHLRSLAGHKKEDEVIIRIVCQELEGWFLGDLDAIKAAYPNAAVSPGVVPAKYRNPDLVTNAAEEVANLTRTAGKVTRAGLIAAQMTPGKNRSHSFNVFLQGVEKLVATT